MSANDPKRTSPAATGAALECGPRTGARPAWRLLLLLVSRRNGRTRQKETRRGRSFGLAAAFPSATRFYQGLTFYPALPYGLDGDRIGSAKFRIIGVGNRG